MWQPVAIDCEYTLGEKLLGTLRGETPRFWYGPAKTEYATSVLDRILRDPLVVLMWAGVVAIAGLLANVVSIVTWLRGKTND